MTFSYTPDAAQQLAKLDKPIQKRIKKYLSEVAELENPRTRGKGLTSNLAGLWRYRVGDYRIVCRIVDDELVIIVVTIGHRNKIYK